MRTNNETCVQSVRLIFNFFEKRLWQSDTDSPIKFLIKDPGPAAVRDLNQFISGRLNRISAMMDLLLQVHSDWVITGKKDKVIMETKTLDYKQIEELFKCHGFIAQEYVLKVDYTRKWGVL